MGLNTTAAEREQNVQEQEIQKRKLEVPVAREFRQMFRAMGKDVADLYTLTGRALDASSYTEDVVSILRPAYVKTTREFSNEIVDHLEANEDDETDALVAALLATGLFPVALASYEGLKNRNIREFIARSVPIRAEEITRTNQKNIGTAISQALTVSDQADEVLTQAQVGTLAGKNFTSKNLFRGRVIAETEVLNAAEGAKLISAETFMDTAGTVADLEAQKIWITRGDERVRPSHVSADSQTKTLNAPFDVGSSQLRFPGDSSLGAPASETINCRCNSQQSIDFAGEQVVGDFDTPLS